MALVEVDRKTVDVATVTEAPPPPPNWSQALGAVIALALLGTMATALPKVFKRR